MSKSEFTALGNTGITIIDVPSSHDDHNGSCSVTYITYYDKDGIKRAMSLIAIKEMK